MEQTKLRRKRGVVLTSVGLKRLQSAIRALEISQDKGERFTLEELSARTNVSMKTLSRLWSLNTSVDQKTLKLCFSTFNLELHQSDYTVKNNPDENKISEFFSSSYGKKETYLYQDITEDSSAKEQGDGLKYLWSYPSGPVPIDSLLYIERPPLEELARREVTQPGCILQIRAPKQMGKSSLVLRLLAEAQQQQYHTLKLDCNQIDSLCLSDINHFFRCFCWRVAKELGIEPNLEANWDEEIGSKLSCSFYLQNYLLKQINRPLVLILEQVERLFEYSQLAREFFPLLRSWYEEARRDTDWQKLRLVVVYSTEENVSLDINRSLFNIGLPLRLSEFTRQQVEELARRYGLDWDNEKQASQLISLVGGHPALIQMALYYLCCQGITLEDLLQQARANGGIYRYHLWRHWVTLQENPTLAEVYAQVVMAASSIPISPIEAYKLESLGLIDYDDDRVRPRCELFRAYFKKQLSTIDGCVAKTDG